MDLFRVRLNCVDHYQATPTEFDPYLPWNIGLEQKEKWPKVPVIRVFGATETGQKVCAHIHGAFPYLYIRYSGALNAHDVDAHIRQLHLSIDHALAVSYRRNTYEEKTQFVAHITLVKGVPFYGYHVGYELFLKVYMLNPLHMARLADLLRQGAILKRVIQPFESHMRYLAQWMCDYNLYGCAYIDCKEVKFRAPVPDYLKLTNIHDRWHNGTIGADLVSDGNKVPRQSHCSIEVDVCVHNIKNRDNVKPRPIHHDFNEQRKSITPDEKLVHSMAGLWQDETRRRKARLGMTDSDKGSPFPPEVLVSMSADSRTLQPGGWIHEEEYKAKMKMIAGEERVNSDGREIHFDNFIVKNAFEGHIKTCLESVEDLYPHNLAQIAASQHATQTISQHHEQLITPEVDESRLLSFDDDDYPHESDDELIQKLNIFRRRNGDVTEDRTDRLEKAQRTLDASEFSITKNDQGPASSTELEKLGVRNTGNLDLIEQDVFEIPKDYISDIGTDQTDIPADEESVPIKRQKMFHPLDLEPIEFDNDHFKLFEKNRHFDKLSCRTGSRKTNPLEPVNRGEIQATKQRLATQPINRPSSFKNVAQVTSNAKLPFSVVKDPQDSNTILTLSQRSNSSSKNSDKSKIKSVSFTDLHESGALRSSPDNPATSGSKVTPLTPSLEVTTCSSQLCTSFNTNSKRQLIFFAEPSPSMVDIQKQMQNDRIPSVLYQDAYYSDERDVPEHPREYAGKDFKLGSTTVPFLPKFDPNGTSPASAGRKTSIAIDRLYQERQYARRRHTCTFKTWEIEGTPPKGSEVQEWLRDNKNLDTDTQVGVSKLEDLEDKISQVGQASQKNRNGFKYSQRQKWTNIQRETQYMSVMSLEVHVNTRGSLVPNPEQDEICCIFWCVQSDDENLLVNGVNEGTHVGILALSPDGLMAQYVSQQFGVDVEQEASELDLMNRLVDIVRCYDPDILTGYEVHSSSWGYVIERARCEYDYNLCDEISRTRTNSHGRFGKEDDRWGFNHTSTIRVTGRHMINIWRAMKGELNLLRYTMENVAFQLCHRRIPHYTFQDLTSWYSSGKPKDLAKVINYYLTRAQLDIEILEQNEIVQRTSEQARLLGVDFFSVFSRGSQFKVESLMFRIAKPENFLLPSPSRKQVGQQNALECLPLVMEPQSAFYNSPILVLDFQSLYPSVMIAYNYCYSTFLGRVVSWRGQNKMGFMEYQRKSRLLELLEDQINVAPNGIMYAKPSIRKSLLAKMLGEILETRVMVKSGMKVDKDDKALQRLLNNRQLALKLIANVTYGYTSASFSGRMPCSEIADSIVQSGRETLEKAIALIHSVKRWGAEVVYGDTDSLFVHLKGRTKDEAFDIGDEISRNITDMNPRPIKLKFEKVYLPCILLAKKRYVGFKYESKKQQVPDFDAKGIEIVRRDGTPAEQKVEEKALKILFHTADLSQVKKYFQRECSKIMSGKVSVQDFCFAKEVKLGTYSDRGLLPPSALISTRKMLEDSRAEPQYGERVPYVVIAGAPGARLIDRCVAPDILLRDGNNELDAEYYISKNLIPPLERIFNLVGANVRQWYDEMPKFQRIRRIDVSPVINGSHIAVSKKTLESYMKSNTCLICTEKLEEGLPICNGCLKDANSSVLALQSRLCKAEKKIINLNKICRSCSGLAWGDVVQCKSEDCPVFYARTRHTARFRNTLQESQSIIGLLGQFDEQEIAW